MENNKLKNVWKIEVDKEIKPYSSRELDGMIIKSAKKSIWKLFPGVWVKVALSVVGIGYFLQKIIMGGGGVPMLIFNLFLICIVLASMILVLWGLCRLKRYNSDLSVKEWIKSRIDEVEKGIAFQKKYNVHIYMGIVGLVVGVAVTNCYLLYGTGMLYAFILSCVVGCLTACFLIRYQKKRYTEVYISLKELYRQIDEQETE